MTGRLCQPLCGSHAEGIGDEICRGSHTCWEPQSPQAGLLRDTLWPAEDIAGLGPLRTNWAAHDITWLMLPAFQAYQQLGLATGLGTADLQHLSFLVLGSCCR